MDYWFSVLYLRKKVLFMLSFKYYMMYNVPFEM